MDPISAILDSDGLVCKILSFLAPIDTGTARKLALKTMSLVSVQFETCFLYILRSGAPLALQFSSGDGDNYDTLDTMIWAKQCGLKIGRIEAFIYHFDIEPFLGALTGLDVTNMKHLNLHIKQRNREYRAEDLEALYTLLAQPSLEDITINDESSREAYLRIFDLEHLKRLYIRGRSPMGGIFSYAEKLPHLEYLKTGDLGHPMPLEINSPSLKVLDISDNFDSVIGQLCCPSLSRLICEDDCVVAGVQISGLLGMATPNDEFGIVEKVREATQVRTLRAEEVIQSQDFQADIDCQFVVVTFYE